MRLILENSTVCLISRRISLLCPVGIVCWLLFVGVGGGVAVSLTMILTDVSFVQSGDVALIDSGCLRSFVGVGGSCFSMESLILAQDERWRRA